MIGVLYNSYNTQWVLGDVKMTGSFYHRILIGVIVPALMAVSAVPAYALGQNTVHPDLILGDANADGFINVSDVTALQRGLVGLESASVTDIVNDLGLLDYTGDGIVDITDATELQRYLAGMGISRVNLGIPKYTWMTEVDPDGEYVSVTAFSQENPLAKAYLSETQYDPEDTSVSTIAFYSEQSSAYNKSKPMGYEIMSAGQGTLTVIDGYTNVVTETEVTAGQSTIYNLTPHCVSRYVLRNNNTVVCYGALYPKDNLRMIMTQRTINMRDIGGWRCDGGTVRYGKLYRGGEVDTSDVGLLHNTLGIRHELTLRYDAEYPQAFSLIGSDVMWSQVNGPWYTVNDPSAEYMILNTVFECVKNGCPLYLHCSAGADRTGTQMLILEALLGMSQSDIEKEYELTTLHTGAATESGARMRNENAWQRLMKELKKYPGQTLRDKAVSFALSIGFTIDDINEYRINMIDGDPELLTK